MGALALDLRGVDGRLGGMGGHRGGPDAPESQPRLFAVPGGAVADPASPVAPAPAEPPAPAAPAVLAAVAAPAATASVAVRTLDAMVVDLFAATASGRQSVCPLCAGAVRPRRTGAGVAAAGTCGDCGSTFG